ERPAAPALHTRSQCAVDDRHGEVLLPVAERPSRSIPRSVREHLRGRLCRYGRAGERTKSGWIEEPLSERRRRRGWHEFHHTIGGQLEGGRAVAAAEAPAVPGLIDEIPMPIIQCPACQGDVLMPEEMAGLRTVCPLCRATFQAPGVEPSAPESGASEEAEAAPTPRRRRRRGRLGDLPLGEACAASPDISLPSRAGSAIEAVRGPGLAMQILQRSVFS